MSPDLSAQIIAKAWSDESFAQALQGPNPYAAIRETLGVEVPEGMPLPDIPPVPDAAEEGLEVQTGVLAGQCATGWPCITCSVSSGKPMVE